MKKIWLILLSLVLVIPVMAQQTIISVANAPPGIYIDITVHVENNIVSDFSSQPILAPMTYLYAPDPEGQHPIAESYFVINDYAVLSFNAIWNVVTPPARTQWKFLPLLTVDSEGFF